MIPELHINELEKELQYYATLHSISYSHIINHYNALDYITNDPHRALTQLRDHYLFAKKQKIQILTDTLQ